MGRKSRKSTAGAPTTVYVCTNPAGACVHVARRSQSNKRPGRVASALSTSYLNIRSRLSDINGQAFGIAQADS